MKKTYLKLLASVAILISLFLFPIAVHAIDVIDPNLCNSTTNANPKFVCDPNDKIADKSSTNPLFGPQGVLTSAINILSLVTAVVATIVIIVAGIRYMVSQGDPTKLSSSRNTIVYAIVGLVIAVAAQGVVALVLKKLQ